eukprot:15254521-Alexandrium_andersonii.AAC.1
MQSQPSGADPLTLSNGDSRPPRSSGWRSPRRFGGGLNLLRANGGKWRMSSRWAACAPRCGPPSSSPPARPSGNGAVPFCWA